MSFKLNGSIVSHKKDGGAWGLDDLKSIGIWENSELISGLCPDGALTNIATQFENTNKSFPDKPKPMTFSWEPSKANKMIFHNSVLKNWTFYMGVGVLRELEDNRFNFWKLSFDEISLIKTSKKGKIERVICSYKKFRFEPT